MKSLQMLENQLIVKLVIPSFMKNLSKIAGIALLSLTTSTWVSAQEKDNKGKNPDSVRPIDESNIMWKQPIVTRTKRPASARSRSSMPRRTF